MSNETKINNDRIQHSKQDESLCIHGLATYDAANVARVTLRATHKDRTVKVKARPDGTFDVLVYQKLPEPIVRGKKTVAA